MKRLTLVAALAFAALAAFDRPALAEEAREAAPVAVAAAEPAADSVLESSVAEPAPDYFAESADPTCEDFGFFAADKKADCDKTCKKGNKCQRKQVCGDGQCPPPGYCWKCPN